jgi:signal transduction histidine kinase
VAARAIVLGFLGSDVRLRTGWVIAGLSMAGVVAAGSVRGASAWVTVQYPVILLVGFLLGLNRRAYRLRAEQAAALLARSEELRAEQARVAALDERARITREIHDVLAHSLGALGVSIQVAEVTLTDRHDVPAAVQLLRQARRMAAESLVETRRAVHALRGEIPPLDEGLTALSGEHQRRHNARVRVEITGRPRELGADARLAISRVAQEALVNSAKHAPHQPIDVRLDYADDDTGLVVRTGLGVGDRPPHGPRPGTADGGYGLAGMRERLMLLDGTLTAGPDGDDWVVEARVPRVSRVSRASR